MLLVNKNLKGTFKGRYNKIFDHEPNLVEIPC